MKKRLSALLSLIMLLGLTLGALPAEAADGTVTDVEQEVLTPVEGDVVLFENRGYVMPDSGAAVLMSDSQEAYEAVKQQLLEQLPRFFAGEISRVQVTVSASSKDEAKQILVDAYFAVGTSYPESLYYFSGGMSYSVSGSGTNWKGNLTPYDCDMDQFMDEGGFRAAIEQACYECFGTRDGSNTAMTDLEKVVIAHDWLAACCRYDPGTAYALSDSSGSWTAPDGNVHYYTGKTGPYSALVSRSSICDGYAKAFKVLMDRAGVNCVYGSGKKGSESHAWNLVELDGNWYQVDTTWDSPIYSGIYDYAGHADRNWLLVGDEQRKSQGYSCTSEYNIECAGTYDLPDAIKNAGSVPAFYDDGYFYLVNNSGTMYRYAVGSNFSSGEVCKALGFSPRAGVYDHNTDTMYFVKSGSNAAIKQYSLNGTVSDFDSVSGYSVCGIYADAEAEGLTKLRAVYCYQDVKTWELGDDNTASLFAGGDGTAENPYRISTSAQLRAFANQVNALNKKCSTASYVLTADIDLGGVSWTPVGTTSHGLPLTFSGTFDGQGHTISGINVNGDSFAGLFSTVSGEVRNLNAVGTVSGGSYVGGIVGGSNGAVTNCSADVSVTAEGLFAGGITGYSYQHPITGCTVSGSVSSAKDNVGGIAGYINNTIAGYSYGNEHITLNAVITGCESYCTVSSDGSSVGGIVGYGKSGSLTSCSNSGAVSANSSVGGIIGEGKNVGTTECVNFGTVSGSGSHIGGICGVIDNSTVTACTNRGAVNGSGSDTGGIAGYINSGTLTECLNYGAITAGSDSGGIVGSGYSTVMTSCSNSGAVFGTYSVGGIAGSDSKGTITHCNNIGNVSCQNQTGGLFGYCYSTNVTDSFNSGKVSGDISGSSLGGLAGVVNGGRFEECYNRGEVTGTSNSIGGLFGNVKDVAAEKCYNTGSVSGGSYVGGLVGQAANNSSSASMSNCYNTAPTAASSSYAGGLVGCAFGGIAFEHCYNVGQITGGSYIGGLAGWGKSGSSFNGCRYLSAGSLGTIGRNDSASVTDVTALTAAGFADWSKFSGWESAVWAIESGLPLSNSAVTARPVLVSIGEHEGVTVVTGELTVSGGTASVTVCAYVNAQAVAASYDGAGRMLSVEHFPLALGESTAVTFAPADGAAAVKVFVLGEAWSPLCECVDNTAL